MSKCAGGLFCAIALWSGAASAQTVPEPAAETIPPLRRFQEAEAAGLPKETELRKFTLQELYWLSLLGEKLPRAKKDPFPSSFELENLADRAGLKDFARIRAALVAETDDNTALDFHNSTTTYIGLLRKRLEVELKARDEKILRSVLEDLRKKVGGPFGAPLVTINQLELTLWKSAAATADREDEYRDALDNFKARLGIPFRTPLVPDIALVSPIREVMDALDRWFEERDLDRDMADLPRILAGLPKAADVVVAGRSVVDVATRHPEMMADLLASAKGRARIDPDGLRLRSRLRHLGRIAVDLEMDREILLRAIRQMDSARRSINAPPQGSNVDTSDLIRDNTRTLIEADAARSLAQSRLVRDWADGHILRIVLQNELDSLPGPNWDAYLKAFSEPAGTLTTP